MHKAGYSGVIEDQQQTAAYLKVFSDGSPEGWAKRKEALVSVRDFARSHGMKLMVVILPTAYQVTHDDESDISVPQQKIMAFTQSTGIAALDPLSALQASGKGAKLFVDNDHLSELGHRLVAESILSYLQPLGPAEAGQ